MPRNSTSTDDFDIESQIPGSFPQSEVAGPTFTTQLSLSQALHARRSEYTRSQNIRIKIGTWNIAALKGTEKDVADWFIEGRGIEEALTGLEIPVQDHLCSVNGSQHARSQECEDETVSVEHQEAGSSKTCSTLLKHDLASVPVGGEIGLYVLGIQEIVDISSPAEALRPYQDPGPANKFKIEIEEALPTGYRLIAEQQLIGLLLLIYASPSVEQDVKSVSTTSVGTGLMGYMGNKGAVTARVILGETTRLVFINSHLSAGADKAALERRNWDASQITSRTKFDPIDDITGISQSTGEIIGEENFAFWFGDLNYRLEGMPGEDVRRLLMLHTRNEYDIGQSMSAAKIDQDTSDTVNVPNSHSTDEPSRSPSPSEKNGNLGFDDDIDDHQELDPASLQATVQSLLPHDELIQQIKARKAFHDGWKEGPIRFLPTYKYDVGSVGVFDSSDKKRCPSWCDRILYRTRRDYDVYKEQVRVEEEAKMRDEEMKARGADKAADDEDVLFDYDPAEDGEQDNPDIHTQEPDTITTKEGFEDEIQLEYYVAHQRILSSDHKPLDAIFSLKYDAVIPEAKTRIHQEVARELDRAENEGRPTITVIIDRPYGEDDHHGETDDGNGTVNFGRVRIGQGKHRTVTIANTGRVPATISFVDRPVSTGQEESPHPAWLTINWDRDPDVNNKKNKNPPTYTLEPGDACNLDLGVRVEMTDFAKDLNEGSTKLDDNLILRVQNGRDHFLPISGKWVRSGLERSINKLDKIAEEGIRNLQNQKPEGSEAGSWPGSHSG